MRRQGARAAVLLAAFGLAVLVGWQVALWLDRGAERGHSPTTDRAGQERAARLLAGVTARLEAAGAVLLPEETVVTTRIDSLLPVTLQIVAEVSPEALRRGLYDLESEEPAFTLTHLHLTPAPVSGSAVPLERLRADFTLAGPVTPRLLAPAETFVHQVRRPSFWRFPVDPASSPESGGEEGAEDFRWEISGFLAGGLLDSPSSDDANVRVTTAGVPPRAVVLLRDPATPTRQIRVGEGEWVDGWQVIRIRRQGITLQAADGRTRDLHGF